MLLFLVQDSALFTLNTHSSWRQVGLCATQPLTRPAESKSGFPAPRANKRKHNDIRPPSSDPGLLHRADGSARFSMGATQRIQAALVARVVPVTHGCWATGKTSVLVGVYGPMQVSRRQELLDRAAVEVALTPLSGQTGPKEVLLASEIRGCVEGIVLTSLHPRTKINVAVQVPLARLPLRCPGSRP